jgi:hypothetical protein
MTNPSLVRQLCFSLSMLAVACGSKAIDLDGKTVIVGNPDPAVLGTVSEQVVTLAVDEQRLYWVGSPYLPNSSGFGRLHSCDKEHCASTLLTYGDSPISMYGATSGLSGIGVRGGELYSFRRTDINQQGLFANDVSDPSRERTLASGMQSFASAIDSDGVFFTDLAKIYALPLTADHDAPRVVSSLPDGDALILAVQGGYVYFIGDRNSVVAVQRTRKDGTGSVEVLADNIKVSTHAIDGSYGEQEPSYGLTVNPSYVYWSENVLVGAVLRCPLSGCTGAPEVVAAPVRESLGLQLDGPTLYFQHATDAFQYGISRCTLGDCAQPELLASGLNTANVFAVDDRYLYVATGSQSLDTINNDSRIAPVATIRRFAK